MRKKLLSLLLAALMILGLLPSAALAAEGDTAPAAPAAEEEVIPAPVEELAAPTVTVGETVYTAVDTGLTMTPPRPRFTRSWCPTARRRSRLPGDRWI